MKLNDFPVALTVAVCITAAALTAMQAHAHDRDAPIDLSELKAEADARFAAADADDSGGVSKDEFVAAEGAFDRGMRRRGVRFEGPRGWLRSRGQDGDHRAAVFAEADTDQDGKLSDEEFAALPDAVERLAKRRLFDRLDDDEDALLSAEEFPSAYNRLAALDADGDGEVSRDEMPRRHRRGRR